MKTNDNAEISNLAAPTTIADLMAELIEEVAEAIEERIGYRNTIKTVGGPYAQSQSLVYERKLREAAVAAITTIVNKAELRQAPT